MNFFDILLAKKLDDMKDSEIIPLEVNVNGTYQQAGKAYSPVVVNIPVPALDTKSITANGTYNASSDNLDGYSSVSVNVPSGGGEYHETLNALIDKSITSITNDSTSIGNSAFIGCTSLTSIDFPEATSIGISAFHGCTSLTTVNFPEVTLIDNAAFNSCTSLTTVEFPKATSIITNAFYACNKLASVNFPEATSIGNYAFYACNKLASINFPEATTIGASAFQGCTELTTVEFPKVATICNNSFKNCSALTSIAILNSTPPTLQKTNAFTGLPNNYVIYVPNGSLTAYQTATNWSSISSHIVELQAS